MGHLYSIYARAVLYQMKPIFDFLTQRDLYACVQQKHCEYSCRKIYPRKFTNKGEILLVVNRPADERELASLLGQKFLKVNIEESDHSSFSVESEVVSVGDPHKQPAFNSR